ncbi:hypothetical protein HNP46_006124 [Pseudomonas nitritireducens]|uniref:Uncharacterized protein n=1 Tax=Pseudomonas nitroreducens TaxID=46680 RepID=A0A7W7KRX8_PSENT|nr:hypothetical protein [Pseudomonas nitritireducens]
MREMAFQSLYWAAHALGRSELAREHLLPWRCEFELAAPMTVRSFTAVHDTPHDDDLRLLE